MFRIHPKIPDIRKNLNGLKLAAHDKHRTNCIKTRVDLIELKLGILVNV